MLGEFGAYDYGDNADANDDTTRWTAADSQWLDALGAFARANLGRAPSWFVWAWQANSVDTKGLVGPRTTWRQVQWRKVRALVKSFQLAPWYCKAAHTAGFKRNAQRSYGCP